jgi:AraC-like DNA-binding protein
MSLTAFISLFVFVVGCTLVFFILKRYRQRSAWFLCLSLLMLSFFPLLVFLFTTKYILSVPFLCGSGAFTGYLAAPALFLYASFILFERKKLQWWDALHLLPAALYLADYLPFLLSSSDHQMSIVLQAVADPSTIPHLSFGLFPIKVHYVARHIISLIYIVSLIVLIYKYSKRYYASIQTRMGTLTWLAVISVLYSFLSVIGIISILFFVALPDSLLGVFNILAIFLATALVFVNNPYVFYSLFNNSVHEIHELKVSHKQARLPEQVTFQLQALLQGYIDKLQFLHKNNSLKEVADQLGTKPYILSAFINQEYRMHFHDLINHYRIEYIKNELLGKERDMLTLEAIAERAGYNNRTTFLAAFKKNTGMTPTDFIKQSGKTGKTTLQKVTPNSQTRNA